MRFSTKVKCQNSPGKVISESVNKSGKIPHDYQTEMAETLNMRGRLVDSGIIPCGPVEYYISPSCHPAHSGQYEFMLGSYSGGIRDNMPAEKFICQGEQTQCNNISTS